MSVTSAPSIRAQRNPTSAPTTPAPTTAMRPEGPGRRVPGRVERGLHVGGQHRARQRNVARHRHHGLGRHVEQGLMGMQRKDIAADRAPPARPRPADRGVAIFHRERKAAAHERRAHALVFAFGHPAGGDQRLGAPADRAVDARAPAPGRPRAAAAAPAGFRPGPARHTRAPAPSPRRPPRLLLLLD